MTLATLESLAIAEASPVECPADPAANRASAARAEDRADPAPARQRITTVATTAVAADAAIDLTMAASNSGYTLEETTCTTATPSQLEQQLLWQ